MSVTPGPSSRLLDAFCALARMWLADERTPVDCEPHGGRFGREEVEQFSLALPSVRAGCLAVASATPEGEDAVVLDLRLAAAVVAGESVAEDWAGTARRLADRLSFELAREQADGDACDLWAQACFSAAELDPGQTDFPRGLDVGDPRDIRAANLYSGLLEQNRTAIWAVTWMQKFRARPQDFDTPLPAPAGIPDSVLSARAPDIGAGHEDGYDRIAPQEAS